MSGLSKCHLRCAPGGEITHLLHRRNIPPVGQFIISSGIYLSKTPDLFHMRRINKNDTCHGLRVSFLELANVDSPNQMAYKNVWGLNLCYHQQSMEILHNLVHLCACYGLNGPSLICRELLDRRCM